MAYDFTTPSWTQVSNMQKEIDELHAENGLKLKQILDLEQLLLDMKDVVFEDDSPCWCHAHVYARGNDEHSEVCFRARKLTEHLWKK